MKWFGIQDSRAAGWNWGGLGLGDLWGVEFGGFRAYSRDIAMRAPGCRKRKNPSPPTHEHTICHPKAPNEAVNFRASCRDETAGAENLNCYLF